MMPSEEKSSSFSDKVILYDNLEKSIEEAFTENVLTFIGGMPKKIHFTLSIICIEGKVNLRCNLKDYEIGTGDVISLVPNTIVEYLAISPDATVIVMAFSDDTFAQSMVYYDYAYTKTRFIQPILVAVSKDILAEIVSAYKQCRRVLKTYGEDVSEDLIKAYMQVMSGLADISRHQWEIATNADDKLSGREKIFQAFLNHVARDFSSYREVQHYAGLACLSPKYFAKVILQASGRHPADWIQDHVILEAKTMLRSGYTIQQTCDALHFQTQSHFGRYFKSATGMTPKQYKNAR